MNKLVTLILTATSLLLISCNTMEGAGKDIKAGGEKLEKAADNNKSK